MKDEQKYKKSLVINTIILSFGTVIPKLATLITLPIITYFLTKEQYGTYDLITTLVTLVLPVATLQMQAAAFRFLIDAKKKGENPKEIITNVLSFSVIISCIVLLILYFVLYKITFYLKILMIVYYLFDILVITLRQIARGLSKNSIYSISVLINSVFELASLFLFVVLFKYHIYGALLSLTIGVFISNLYLIKKIKIHSYIDFKTISKKKIKNLVAYSWPLIPNSLSSWVMSLSDRFLITLFMGPAFNAVYSVANKIPHLFSLVQGTFNQAWQENASIVVEKNNTEKYYSNMFDIILNFLTGIMALIIAFTPLIFILLIRGDYREAYNHIPILLMATFFSAISSYLGGIYIAHKKSLQIGLTTTVSAAINFIINIIFIKSIGIYAASLSTLISYIILAVFRMINIQKIQRIKFNIPKILFNIITLFFMLIICFMQNFKLNIVNGVVGILFAIILNKNYLNILIKKCISKIKRKKNNNNYSII